VRITPGSPEWLRRDAMYRNAVREQIIRNGWVVQGVFPTAEDPGPQFTYTIGLVEAGLPELLIMGLPTDVGAVILNAAAKRHLEHEFTAGDTWEFPEVVPPLPFRVVDIPARHSCLGTAYRIYERNTVRGLQLVWADVAGRFPGEDGYDDVPQDLPPSAS
jgi:hypothetical protein